jgi:hypothetical protein
VVFNDDRVGHNLVACLQHGDIVHDQLRRRDLLYLSVAQHPGARGVEDRQPVKQLLGPVLLNHPDHGIADRGEAEECVPPLAQEQQQEETAANNAVQQCQYIGPENLPQAPAGGIRNAVVQPCQRSLPYFGCREACSCTHTGTGRNRRSGRTHGVHSGMRREG